MGRPKKVKKVEEVSEVVEAPELAKVAKEETPKDDLGVVIEEPEEEYDPGAQYVVAEKRYIACRKGVLRPGEPVVPVDFGGGHKAMKEHYERGGIEKAKA